MNQIKSPCPQENKSSSAKVPQGNSKWKTGIVFVAAFLSISIIGLWIVSIRSSSTVVAFLGAGYALLCTALLAAQMIAFVRAHMDYDQTIEKPKYDLLKMEAEEWNT